ncbi:MAG: excinuclease ABC subunit UvrA [Pirellulales bacterium]|nr:excinuclease ABC subunit UvrA [Pirellulales bacterium]
MNRSATEIDLDAEECIRIRGARMHNLRNLDVDLPRNRLVVLTGPSGSGKSTLAFDTLYAEGQRQYIESLSVYARQFLHQLERPDVDLIEGLQPTISIDQRAGSHNPRSTVATITEIYDYLRLLFARLGEARCYQCGEAIRPQTPEQILDALMELPAGTRVMILAPLVRGRKGRHEEVFAEIRKAGLLRARVDGEVIDVHAPPPMVAQKTHHVEAVIDRVVVREGIRARLAESIRLALEHGDGAILVANEERSERGSRWHDRLFSTLYACPNCKISYEELEPRTFSFNSPYGACPTCEGLGCREGFDPELVVPDWGLSLAGGAVGPWRNLSPAALKKLQARLRPFLSQAGLRWNSPLEKLSPRQRELFLFGEEKNHRKKFPGVLTLLEKEYATATSDQKRHKLATFRGQVPCAACHGARLRPEACAVRVAGKAIHEMTALSTTAARRFFEQLLPLPPGEGWGEGETAKAECGMRSAESPHPSALRTPHSPFTPDQLPIARPLVEEILSRLKFLEKVGLDYLTLDRPADTLSGGELQRVRLASGLGSGLVGVCYVLDEPSIGLHPRDNRRLLDALSDLRQQGNTVVVVEHDEAIIRTADWIVDLGPGAGRHGGQIVARGTPRQITDSADSLTGRYLAGKETIPVPPHRRRVAKTRAVTLEGVTTNNLKNISVAFPLSALVCVTGVSGSGKSSLLSETLSRALVRRLGGLAPKPGPHAGLRGVSQIDKVVQIDQSPIGRTPRSNPATYTSVFDEIRKVFANTRDARQRGYKSGRFSFNVRGGRCEECQGQGLKKIEMNFLPDLYVTCSACEGKRFNRQTLEIRYKDLSIAEVLDLRIDEAAEFFANFPVIARLLGSLQEVGLGYMTLGQSSSTLSGGEAQRVKLAAELGRVNTGKTLYILDEPTTGLHFDDTRKLLQVLNRLVDLGNTVIVIEHNLDVIKTADWILDLGPEGGDAGGRLVASGTPEELAALPENYTGRFLRNALDSHAQKTTDEHG